MQGRDDDKAGGAETPRSTVGHRAGRVPTPDGRSLVVSSHESTAPG